MPEAWTILAVTAIVLYGVGQTLSKLSLRGLTAAQLVVLSVLIHFPMYLFFFSYYLGYHYVNSQPIDVPPEYVMFGLLGASCGLVGYYFYIEALSRGPVTIVGSVTAAYPILTVFAAITFLGESLTALQSLGVSMIIAGMILLSYSRGNGERTRSCPRICIFLSISCVLLWGLWSIFVKIALDALDEIFFLGLYALIYPLATFGYLSYRGMSLRELLPGWTVPAIIAIIALMISQIAFFAETYAIKPGEASIVFPLIASYPVVMMLLAYIFLKERLSRLEWVLAMVVVAGIILVSTV